MSKKIVAGYNDLLTLRPDVASEWDSVANEELLPSQVGVGSRKRVAWVCTKQHHWKAIIGNRTGVSGSSKTGSGCPVCAGRTVQPGENDLATLYPEIASEWNHVRNGTLKPTNVRPGANKKVYWTCSSCGYVWPAKIQDRALKNYGCPVCADKTVIRGVNDLATEYPDIAKDWDYQKNKKLKPDMIRPQSNFKVSWICHVCNEAWDEYVSVRVNKSKGCPYCTGQKPIVGKTDLATCFPKIATEWDHDNNEGLIPESYLPNASKRINWMCNICGHKWPARICDRVRSNIGCPRCAGKKTIPGITDLTTTHPELAREWHPQKNKKLTPNAVSAGSGKRVWWICHVCDESWQTSIYTRSSKQTG